MSRIWTVSAAVECSTCGTKDDKTSVAATSCETAREGVLRILRYRGWRIGRKTHDNSCPRCAGPIPGCADCGTPTPDPYGKSDWEGEQHKVRRCAECHRKRRAAQWRERYPGTPVPDHLTREGCDE